MRAICLGLVALLATVAAVPGAADLSAGIADRPHPAEGHDGVEAFQRLRERRQGGFDQHRWKCPRRPTAQLAGGLTKEALARQGVTAERAAGTEARRQAGDPGLRGPDRRRREAAQMGAGVSRIRARPASSWRSAFEGGYSERRCRRLCKSVALRAPLSIDEQLAALPFKLGTTAGLRPVRSVSGNALILTEGPHDVVKEAEQPVLVVASSFAPSPPPGEARERFARAALASNQTVQGHRHRALAALSPERAGMARDRRHGNGRGVRPARRRPADDPLRAEPSISAWSASPGRTRATGTCRASGP